MKSNFDELEGKITNYQQSLLTEHVCAVCREEVNPPSKGFRWLLGLDGCSTVCPKCKETYNAGLWKCRDIFIGPMEAAWQGQ